ncbi:MAG TPA: hypothetical protein VI757_08005 [Bacteroidia bacterium]|nr:hypothetical protein [Bacteroidia bacterium]
MTIKEWLGDSSLKTTSIYVHVSKKHISKVQSPLDKLGLLNPLDKNLTG